MLQRCRFLLPLSKKRHNFVKEMLRHTERSAPSNGMPVISVDRRVPVAERHKHGESSTVFMQIFSYLKNKDLHYRYDLTLFSMRRAHNFQQLLNVRKNCHLFNCICSVMYKCVVFSSSAQLELT